ncbi:MAG: hypothetical protein L6Q37_12055, partial [Bdellovibrionaceae bacterium]|nr:hypothetical protein [Pseudobdellovibrionaceae bacterium]
MKKMILVLTSLLLLTSCEELTGTLEVFSQFKANVKNKCDWNPFVTCPDMAQIEVYPGTYQAEMEVFSKSEFRLHLKNKNFKETIIFSKPKYFNIPDNGRFELSA